MVGLIVTGHGKFASGFKASLKLLAGTAEGASFIDFSGESGDELKVQIAEVMDTMKEYDGVLVLSDLPGGTPYNKSVELKMERTDQKIEVMAGTNLPLLLACATMVEAFDTPLDMAKAMIADGKDSMVIFGVEDVEEGEAAEGGDFDDFI